MDRMILLRNARQDELSGLSGLCLRSKAHWGYDAAFMAACRAELTLHPDDLETTSLQVAERAGSVAGLAQVRITGADADLLKLFIEPALIGAGIGRLLFEWATAKARELGATRMMMRPILMPLRSMNGWARIMRGPLLPDRFRDECCRAC
jgi:GNAT superfamily N-acetyltransferase